MRLAVLCGFVCALLCAGCGGPSTPVVSVPPGCQQWLTVFFDALKAKDTGKIQDLTSQISAYDFANIPAESQGMMRNSKKAMTATVLQKIYQDLGDFKTYSVASCKVTTIAKGEKAVQMFGEGTFIEIVCETKFSKRKAKASFTLHKGPKDSDPIVEAAWNFAWSPL